MKERNNNIASNEEMLKMLKIMEKIGDVLLPINKATELKSLPSHLLTVLRKVYHKYF